MEKEGGLKEVRVIVINRPTLRPGCLSGDLHRRFFASDRDYRDRGRRGCSLYARGGSARTTR